MTDISLSLEPGPVHEYNIPEPAPSSPPPPPTYTHILISWWSVFFIKTLTCWPPSTQSPPRVSPSPSLPPPPLGGGGTVILKQFSIDLAWMLKMLFLMQTYVWTAWSWTVQIEMYFFCPWAPPFCPVFAPVKGGGGSSLLAWPLLTSGKGFPDFQAKVWRRWSHSPGSWPENWFFRRGGGGVGFFFNV